MTHSYEFMSSTPYTRRKLNSAFVHNLKKLCGGKYGVHVFVVLNDPDYGDYVYFLHFNNAKLMEKVTKLMHRYGIGDEYIQRIENLFDEDESSEYVHIYLSEMGVR